MPQKVFDTGVKPNTWGILSGAGYFPSTVLFVFHLISVPRYKRLQQDTLPKHHLGHESESEGLKNGNSFKRLVAENGLGDRDLFRKKLFVWYHPSFCLY